MSEFQEKDIHEKKEQINQNRREAICPYFNQCGGCSSQHIPYEEQLSQKVKILKNRTGIALLESKNEASKDSSAHELNNKIPVTILSDNEYNYRNRMDFIFHKNGIGFRKKNEWKKIINIKECAISNTRLNELLTEVRNFFFKENHGDFDAFNQETNSGTFRYAVIRTPSSTSSISFVVNADSTKLSDATQRIEEFAKISTADSIIITQVENNTDVSTGTDYFCVKGSDMITESICEKAFQYSIQGFFQNNSIVAGKMHEYVHNILKEYSNAGRTSSATLLDLYGGVGTFGIINAELFKKVITAEFFIGCVDSAKQNITLNKLSQVSAIQLDAKNLRRLELKPSSETNPLFVITDPPRSGMDPATIAELNKLQPECIIYISCNVEQLGKDIPKFKNYTIKRAALVDMFPQTPHIEGIVELIKK